MKVILVSVTLFQLTAALLHRCPPSENLSGSCTCSKTNTVLIKCQNVKTDDEMRAILKSLHGYVVDHLLVKNSGPFNFNCNPFQKLYIQNLTFQEVHFSVFNLFHSLQGLEFILEELRFINCKISAWMWRNGLHFVYLRTVHFENTTLPQIITKEIMAVFPKTIRTLHIIACSIKTLENEALKRLAHLEDLRLDRNRLTVLKRSMFAIPARRLKSLSLNKNRIQSLPKDFFHKMTRLEFLFLEETQLKLLQEEVFRLVWEQLEEVSFNNIQLSCDCQTAWLLNKTKDKAISFPTCKSSFGGKHRSLKHFTYKEICSR